jgi:hypothetical protein
MLMVMLMLVLMMLESSVVVVLADEVQEECHYEEGDMLQIDSLNELDAYDIIRWYGRRRVKERQPTINETTMVPTCGKL